MTAQLLPPAPRYSDERRVLLVPGDKQATLQFCLEHFIDAAIDAIDTRGKFTVALSGGSTPIALFTLLAEEKNSSRVDWSKVHFFWGDERAVGINDKENNYGNARRAGLDTLKGAKLYRMKAEIDPEENAVEYEKKILQIVPEGVFDLVTLGMGEDGHTASLFPGTPALIEREKLVTAQEVPEKGWRMTFTFPLINRARQVAVYVLGAGKKEVLAQVLSHSCTLPSFQLGTPNCPTVWIADTDAAELMPAP